MFDANNEYKILNVMMGNSAKKAHFSKRYAHAFIYKISGESKYTFNSENILLKTGDILFIPKHETYSVEKISKGNSRYFLIDFDGIRNNSNLTPMLFSVQTFDAEELFYEMETIFRCVTDLNMLKCKSIFYELIYELVKISSTEYLPRNSRKLIECAMTYFEKNMFDTEFDISMLYKLCGVSDTYFRRIFYSQYKTTPIKYITQQRLARARLILINEPNKKICEIAYEVGYQDEFYFSKLFKKAYGKSPNKYKRDFWDNQL